MADAIRKQFQINAEMIEGDAGEWRVLVEGKEVARKGFLLFPSDAKVLAAVGEALRK